MSVIKPLINILAYLLLHSNIYLHSNIFFSVSTFQLHEIRQEDKINILIFIQLVFENTKLSKSLHAIPNNACIHTKYKQV